jgi:hypothetical protein
MGTVIKTRRKTEEVAAWSDYRIFLENDESLGWARK